MRRCGFFWFGGAVWCGAVQAAEQNTIPAFPTGGLGAGSMLQTAGGLLLVLAVIVVLGWLFRRMSHLPMGGKGGQLRLTGALSLGARERIVVVEVEGERLLLGVAPGRVETLHVLPRATTEAAFSERLAQEMEEGAA